MQVLISKQAFGKLGNGQEPDRWILTNSHGLEVTVTNYGAAIVSLKVPDRAGKLTDVVLGYATADEYEKDPFFMGSIVGRYGNRIANARFTIDDRTYELVANDGRNTLHGGPTGFYKLLWRLVDLPNSDNSVKFSCTSPDGDQGFPGELLAEVTYTLTENNELRIEYSSTTNKKTVVNLTNHAYFNLSGEGKGTILAHEIWINANYFTPVDATLIPTGELRAVRNTPMDFTTPASIGLRIDENDEQLRLGNGYDHNWVLNKSQIGVLTQAARVYEPSSGRVLEVWTTEPGLQFYSGNALAVARGKAGKEYRKRSGFCLESQHFPNSPNTAQFPSTLLTPGERYSSTTVLKFSMH